MLRLIPTEPASDFATYFDLARRIASGTALPMEDFAPRGLPLVLAPCLWLLGARVVVALGLNVAPGLAALLSTYALFRRAAGEGAARAGALLFVPWPAQALFTPIVATEHLATALSIALLAASAALAEGRRFGRGTLLSVGVGVLAGLIYLMRPATAVLFGVGLVAACLRRTNMAQRSALALLMVGTTTLTLAGQYAVLRAWQGFTPPSAIWWNLYVGTNREARGIWNLEDAGRYFALPVAQRDAFARAAAWQRITSDPPGFGRLTLTKASYLWARQDYGAYWSTCTLPDTPVGTAARAAFPALRLWSRFTHVAIFAVAVVGGVRLWRSGASRAALLLLIVPWCGTLLHAVFEVQDRYQHTFMIGVLFLAALGLAGAVRTPAAPVVAATPAGTRHGESSAASKPSSV